jgi:hypothetical protein
MKFIVLACSLALAACGTNTVTYIYVDAANGTDTAADDLGVDTTAPDTTAPDTADDAVPDDTGLNDAVDPADTADPPDATADTSGPDVQPTGTCGEFFACASNCSPMDASCGTSCAAERSPTAAAQVAAFQQCLAVKGCNLAETDKEYLACIDEFCYEPYFACFSTPGGLDCAGLASCFAKCPVDDPSTPGVNEAVDCKNDCYLAASYQGNMDLVNFKLCVWDACPVCKKAKPTPAEVDQCNTCMYGAMKGACKTLNDTCTPAGTNGCKALRECLTACTDQECYQGCTAAATLKAQAMWNDFKDCVVAACPDWGEACMESATTGACKANLDACLAD